MQTVKFVIGAVATGKTHFINENYGHQDVTILNAYDYQQRVYEEEGLEGKILLSNQFSCLMKANNMLLENKCGNSRN